MLILQDTAICLMGTENGPFVDELVCPHIHGSVADALSAVQVNRIRHPVLIHSTIHARQIGAQAGVGRIRIHKRWIPRDVSTAG